MLNTELTWGSQPRWRTSGIAKVSGHHNQSLTFLMIMLNALLPDHSPHAASLSLNLTKLKVYVSPQVGVTMETTVIQCSQQQPLNERSCLMELKSRLSSSSHVLSTHSTSSETIQGKCVHNSITYISSSTLILLYFLCIGPLQRREHFYTSEQDQMKLEEISRQVYLIFDKTLSLIVINNKSQRKCQFKDQIY